jgi:uncharacterized LabA/DUF88 family protein
MGRNFIYVDNSNVFIEGSRVSAVKRRILGAETIVSAMRKRIVDHAWQLDYGSLHSIVCGQPEEIGAAYLWGSPPPGDSFWRMVEQYGFRVTTFERNAAGKEKKVDVAIAHQMTKDAYSGVIDKAADEITLVAGDKDYVPVVDDLVKEGFRVIVAFWAHAADELKRSSAIFFSLDPHLETLTRKWSLR